MQNNSGDSHCVLTVAGSVAQSVTELLRVRFDGATMRVGDDTLVIVDDVDQAALRAVMITLWDSGHDVVTMVLGPAEQTGPRDR